MRLLVCGGRHFEDAEKVFRELVSLHWKKPISVVIHGGIMGPGIAAEAWARKTGVPVVRYPPNWELHGSKAERLRSEFMLHDSRPALVMAFPGGRNTADLVRRAINAKIAVIAIPADGIETYPIQKQPRSDGLAPARR